MRVQVLRADPAGNITLFVLTPVEKEKRGEVARRLLAMPRFGAEQLAFCLEAEEGLDGRILMSGGEFCGNASRAYGMLLARERGAAAPASYRLRVSGAADPVRVEADPAAGIAWASMPIPLAVMPAEAAGRQGTLVHLGGIAHFVVEGEAPSETFFAEAERALFSGPDRPEAYGVMFLGDRQGEGETALTPLVKVPAVDTLFWEGSCGSGSLAALAALIADARDGLYEETFRQPAGAVTARLRKEGGAITEACIGGPVTLGEAVEVEI